MKQRLRILIEIDTDMTRHQFNRHVKATARVFANSMGEMVYLATDTAEAHEVLNHDTTEKETK